MRQVDIPSHLAVRGAAVVVPTWGYDVWSLMPDGGLRRTISREWSTPGAFFGREPEP